MNDRELRIAIPPPVFTLFDASREGMPEIIVANEALLSFAHTEVFSWYLKVTIQAQDLIENGMPSPQESAVLFDIGDEIEDNVQGGETAHGSINALFLARSTWNAIRELRFLVHDPEIAHSRLQTLLASKEWSRPWEYEMHEDPEWERAGYVFQLFRQARGSDA